jgi:hypothetical protein
MQRLTIYRVFQNNVPEGSGDKSSKQEIALVNLVPRNLLGHFNTLKNHANASEQNHANVSDEEMNCISRRRMLLLAKYIYVKINGKLLSQTK